MVICFCSAVSGGWAGGRGDGGMPGWWFVIYARERVLNMKQRVWGITKEINRLAGIGSRCSKK